MASIMAAAGGCASHAQGIKLNDNDLVIEVFESTKKHRLETSFEISSKGSPSYPHSRGHQKTAKGINCGLLDEGGSG